MNKLRLGQCVMLVSERISVSDYAQIGADARLPASPGQTQLAGALESLGIQHDDEWAWANYKRVVSGLCDRFSSRRLIEIGGGRDPLFSPEEISALGVEMTVNDIAPGEIAVLPGGYKTACFDIAGDISMSTDLRESFDLAFSRMVFEHVEDGRRAWSNLYNILAPGGVALAFVPTLYAVPFVANRLLPDKLAAAIVRAIFRHRTDEADPVFPARYSWCIADQARIGSMLAAIGYREVAVLPFYGHGYYRYFPVIRDIHRRFTALARRRDWRLLASFAYIAARK
jgi:SAM-dependent methyltransferase